MFEKIREGIQETSTKEVNSLPRLRSDLTSTHKVKIKYFDFNFMGPRSAELRLEVFKVPYFGDFASIINFKYTAKVKKVVNDAFPLLCQ